MTQRRCSFCGKQQDRVKRLIAGPGIYICDECVELCREILAEGTPSEQPVVPTRRLPEILTMRALPEALANLSYRERRVLELSYGLSGEEPRTAEEIGATFELSGDQVREIEAHSLQRLQSSSELRPE